MGGVKRLLDSCQFGVKEKVSVCRECVDLRPSTQRPACCERGPVWACRPSEVGADKCQNQVSSPQAQHSSLRFPREQDKALRNAHEWLNMVNSAACWPYP